MTGRFKGTGKSFWSTTGQWTDVVQLFKCAETTPPHSVPMTQYIYLRETDNKIVGVMQIRHDCNTFLAQYGGHIGYSVCPSERRKGYATQMLRLALPKCKELGIDQVLICCAQGNEAYCGCGIGKAMLETVLEAACRVRRNRQAA